MIASLLKFLALLAAAYGLLLAWLYWQQPRMLYFPQPMTPTASTPARAGLDYEDVNLLTDDGVALHGWYLPQPGAELVALFFHGNAGNIADRLDTLRLVHDLGLAVLMIDYRGYGRSQGRPSEQGTALDADAAWRHLVEARGWDPRRVVIWGRSLGGAVAVQLATRRPSRSIIIESSFTSVPDLAAGIYPWLPVRLLSRYRYDSLARIGTVERPVLVVHSRDDEIIPVGHGRRLYAAARQPKAFLEIRGPHNGGHLGDRRRYLRGLAEFLSDPRPLPPGGNPG